LIKLDLFKRETPTEFGPEQLARPDPEPAAPGPDGTIDAAFEAVGMC
jgi:hypothetical protein